MADPATPTSISPSCTPRLTGWSWNRAKTDGAWSATLMGATKRAIAAELTNSATNPYAIIAADAGEDDVASILDNDDEDASCEYDHC